MPPTLAMRFVCDITVVSLNLRHADRNRFIADSTSKHSISMCSCLAPKLPNVIWLGEFDYGDTLITAFFHELAHCIGSVNLWDFKIEEEIQVWQYAFDLMRMHGFEITSRSVRYCLDCLRTYAGHEIREYTASALENLRNEMRRKNFEQDDLPKRISEPVAQKELVKKEMPILYSLFDKKHRHLFRKLEAFDISSTERLLNSNEESLAMNGFTKKSILYIQNALAVHGLTLPATYKDIT